MRGKNLFLTICLCAIGYTPLFSQKISEDNLPIKLVALHYKDYPNSTDVTWKMVKLGNLEVARVDFTHGDKQYIVKYNLNAKKLEEQEIINTSNLYPSVYSDLKTKYGKYKIVALAKSLTNKNEELYMLYIKSKTGMNEELLDGNMELVSNPRAVFAAAKSR